MWVTKLNVEGDYKKIATVNGFCIINDQKFIQTQMYADFEMFLVDFSCDLGGK